MKTMIAAVVLLLAFASSVGAQSKPTPAEIQQWKEESDSSTLESSACKKITWLLDHERTGSAELPKQKIRYALGWWGRGFIEGAVYIIGGDKVEKKAEEFGLSVDVVAAHLAAYCYECPKEIPFDAVQELLMKGAEVELTLTFLKHVGTSH